MRKARNEYQILRLLGAVESLRLSRVVTQTEAEQIKQRIEDLQNEATRKGANRRAGYQTIRRRGVQIGGSNESEN